VNQRTLALWARVLTAVAGSRLLLLAPVGDIRNRTRQRFAELGVTGDRIDFIARQERPPYLREFQKIDLCLDTLPYNGHTTSLDSFWMGVPVITRLGETVVGRAGFSQCSNLGLTDLVAQSDEEFVEIALEWSGDLPRLTALRQTLRERMMNSPLADAGRFARAIESAFLEAWKMSAAHDD
jgi:predicted O-linked N-acetylglucosamine transferase (SPINDLY family)